VIKFWTGLTSFDAFVAQRCLFEVFRGHNLGMRFGSCMWEEVHFEGYIVLTLHPWGVIQIFSVVTLLIFSRLVKVGSDSNFVADDERTSVCDIYM